jgi:D-psicose/D-tagatose/L-ribulose 3-epimerase
VKLAISNIAWPTEHDSDVAQILRRNGVTAIEIAPTKIWPSPLRATMTEIRAYRDKWLRWDIKIVAAQALLFGQPALTIFDNADVRSQTVLYLVEIIRLCTELGVEVMVFGSPKNRLIGSLGCVDAWQIAVDFFGTLGETASRFGTTLVIEANPEVYDADFVTRASEAIKLVRDVNHPGFGLHLDSGCMTLSSDAIGSTIADGIRHLRHFHISEPFLAPIGDGSVDHVAFAAALRSGDYDHWASIEMKQQALFSLDSIEKAIVQSRCYRQELSNPTSH